MSVSNAYARAAIAIVTPAALAGAVLGQTMVVAVCLAVLVAAFLASPSATTEAIARSLAGMGVLAAIALAVAVAAAGLFVFQVGVAAAAVWAMGVGSAIVAAGAMAAREVLISLWTIPEPAPAWKPQPRPRPVPTPLVEPLVEPVAAEPPPPPPPPKPKPRETVLIGGREFPAAETDPFFYVISGPPGQGKSVLVRLFLLPIAQEILETEEEGGFRLANDSRLIVFDPKREIYAWLASMWPAKTLAPLRLMLPSDVRSVVPDFNRDYHTITDAEAISHALFPEDPRDSQKFFPDSLRTLVAMAITAIRGKLGFWNLRLLVLVLSNTGYLRRLVGNNPCTRFAQELLSSDSRETAQNVQMTITSKLLKFRLLAAHFDRVKNNALSLERFLAEPGVLVLSRDAKYHVQHDGLNGVLINRIGQIVERLQQDPTRRRKTYFVLDEFPVLAGDKPVPGIVDMFLRLRSLGVVFLITFQTYATMKRVYGDQADEILNTTRNFTILGSGDPTDAKHAAELVGKIRGFEAQRNSSATEGENEGTSDSANEGTSKSTGKSWGGQKSTSGSSHGFGWNDGANWGKSEQESRSTGSAHSRSRGRSNSSTRGVTWVWFDRDIKSATELMRTPLPTDGVTGIAYRAGEPAPWDFSYDWRFVNSRVHDSNNFILEYVDRKDDEEILAELTPEELRLLGLEDLAAKDAKFWDDDAKDGGQAIAAGGEGERGDVDDDGDWDEGREGGEGGSWNDAFANDQ